MRDHSKLKAFQVADELVLLVYKATSRFPKEEQFGLKSQMRRAAVSIPTNIVEGSARNSESDYLRFLDIAYGSCREIEYLCSVAQQLQYLDESSDVLSARCTEVAKMLNGLIRSLRTSR